MDFSIAQKQKMIQKTTPQAIETIQLLSLCHYSLETFLYKASLQNPMIELEIEEPIDYGLDDITFNELYSDFSYQKGSTDKSSDQLYILPQQNYYQPNNDQWNSLYGNLKLQLITAKLSKTEEKIGLEILNNLNDNGYFIGSLIDICRRQGAPLSTGSAVLSLIQTFYPKGIAARNLSESLLLQLDKNIENYEVIKKIINQDIDGLGAHKFNYLAKKYSLKSYELQKIDDYIKSLNPRPGADFKQEQFTQIIYPDMSIKRSGDQLDIKINGEGLQQIHIRSDYISLIDNPDIDTDTRLYLKAMYNNAINLIKVINMRQNTLKKLTIFLSVSQRDFFKHGPKFLKPLTMKDAAKEIKVHPSTVCRSVNNKYIETDWGIFPVKYFFSTKIQETSGKAISSTIVKDKLKKIINLEDSSKPYSDKTLSELLNKENITISRRTVAKYREELGIQCQSKRKQFL